MAERNDPYRTYNFAVELDNIPVAGFSEATGLTFELDSADYREGSDPMYVRKLSGLRKFPNITLKRGLTQSRVLYKWYAEAFVGAPSRRNGAIVLHDEEGKGVVRWNFFDGWLSKWEGPSMNATSNEVAIETIEIRVERIELAEEGA